MSTACWSTPDPAYRRIWSRWATLRHLDPDLVWSHTHGRRPVDTIAVVAPHLDVDAEYRLVREIMAAEGDAFPVYPDAAAALSLLDGYPWGVVTSGRTPTVKQRLRAGGLPDPPVMVDSSQVRRGKPSPEGYLRAAHLLDTPASIHPLIRAAADPVAQLSLAVTLLAGFADGDPDDSGQWPKWQAAAPHAFHLLNQAARTTDTDLIIRAARIAEDAARHLNATGLYAVALDHLRALRSIREREQGASHPDTLTIRYRLAYTTGFAGDPMAARDQFAALLSAQERALGADHPDTLDTRNQLARWTGETGDIVAARDQYAALLPVQKRILGPEHPATLASWQGLAQWTGWTGDSAAARDQFAALLPVRERVLGDEHPDTLATRHRLAQWTGWSGDARAARDLLIGVADSCRRVLGAEHPDCLDAQHHLARWIGYAGDAATARDQFAALLPIREHVLGPEHPQTLATRHGLAFWIGAAGDAAAARDLFAALVPVRERVQGPEHPDTLGSKHELAYWTGKAGDAEGSRAQFAALLPVCERVLGVDHPDTIDTRRKLIEPLDVTARPTPRWSQLRRGEEARWSGPPERQQPPEGSRGHT
ncbi:tetratricopeptide repeat protein [Micromonospora arida]|uniref:tetratricopeptide repeat protein n=1 Tax=Micromonospora arida TaxID=2203715 RepID=UPI0033B32058